MTSSVAGWRRSSKALLKAKPVPKKVMVTVWLSAAHLIHYCFLNPSETIIADKYVQQIDEMHRKLQCMQPAGQHKGPNSSPWQHLTTCGTTKASKGEWIRLQQVLPQLPYSPKLLPTDYLLQEISTTFCREKPSTMSRRPKMLSKSLSGPEA